MKESSPPEAGAGDEAGVDKRGEADVPDNSQSHVVPIELETSSNGDRSISNDRSSFGSVSSHSDSMQELSYGRYNPRDQVLRLEFITDDEARRSLAVLKVSSALGLLSTIFLVVLKTSGSSAKYFVLNRDFHICNVVLGAVLLLLVVPYFGFWLYRVYAGIRSGKSWSKRRKAAVIVTFIRGCTMTAILFLFVTQNLTVLVDPDMWCNGTAVQYQAFFTWTSWNVLFCIIMYDAHCLVSVKGSDKKDHIIRDLPLSFHWKKLALWLLVEGTLIWTVTQTVTDGSVVNISHEDGRHVCEWHDKLQCSPRTGVVVSSSLTLAGFVLYWLLAVRHLVLTWRQLHSKPYLDNKILHNILRLQIRFIIGFTLIIFSAAILWLVGPDSCANFAVSWFGMLPMIIVMTGFQWLLLFVTLPRHPDAPPPKMNEFFQQFAWTEASKPRLIERRNQALILCPAGVQEPMFCFETAIHLFYWSVLIYDFTEAEGHTFSNLPQTILDILGEVETAMGFYKLVKRRLFYDRTLETKVLSAWNENTILICIRGSSAAANFVADAQLLQTPHPPERKFHGRTPKVHRGFLKTWQAGGINELLVQHVAALLDSAEDRSKVQVLLTGHSLGGAVAILATYDIITKCNLRPDQVTVYTFGAPRVGNRAFAREYGQMAPDTWNVINDQDLVTRGMKLYGLYKRAGHRVIINSAGDLIVRPGILEVSLMQMPFRSSALHHFTPAYQDAFASVLQNQLSKGKRQREHLVGVYELLKSTPIVHSVLESYDQKLGLNVVDQIRSIGRSLSSVSGSMRLGSLSRARGKSTELDAAIAAAIAAAPPRLNASGELSYESVYDGPITGPDDVIEVAGEDAALPATKTSSVAALQPAVLPSRRGSATDKATGRSMWGVLRQGLRQKRLARSLSAEAPIAELVGVTIEPSHSAQSGATCSTHSCQRPRRCYIIPEEDSCEVSTSQTDAETAARPEAALATQTEGDNALNPRRKRCTMWHCPLTAAPENLPANAKITGTGIVEIGAIPDMKACRFVKRCGGMASAPANALT